MPITQLYHTWKQQILELHPQERMTRVNNFAWLLVRIFESHSVHLSRIAGKIPGQAKRTSTTRRLPRLLDNAPIRVREWYEPIACQWLQAQYDALREIRLIVDGTKVGFGHQLLIVSIAYRRRATPIAWTWVKHVRGHSVNDGGKRGSSQIYVNLSVAVKGFYMFLSIEKPTRLTSKNQPPRYVQN